ncbi:hypothetical protein [Limnoglobus roseus]|uniref:Uncharacterized protein n=1 Tax=Limnoglobus roseus TaxID=2598579 RepID=A0A5C1AHL2_9BACT|nr:hypothetical protein [Limnoglobus roseus]QEL17753.1 hypothetical protein PX52LOC_04757 [Limnoglobus roseus]
MTWNTTDLTKVAVVSAAFVGVLRAVFGRPLVRAVINPHRLTWLLVAAAFAAGAAGLLRDATNTGNPLAWLVPLESLVTEERASGHVLVAAFALLNAGVILGVLAFCQLRLPRDPRAFRKRSHLAAAVQYYTALRGGIDFAALIRLGREEGTKPQVLAVGVNRAEIQERLAATSHPEAADDRIRHWLDLAVELHHEFAALNGRLAKGGQGHNRRVLLDVQYGGYLFQYVRPPESGDDVLFLFAATVLQQEVTTRQFEDHFELIVQAVRNVTAASERL